MRFFAAASPLVVAFASCAERPAATSRINESAPPTAPAVAAEQAPSSLATADPPAEAAPAPSPAPIAKRDELTTTRFQSLIWEQPREGAAVVGYLRAGERVAKKPEVVAPGPSVAPCPGKWHAIEPLGYVCEGRDGVTSDLEDPVALAAAKYAARRTAPLPWGYGMSLGAPMYARVPTLAEQKQVEGDIDAYRAQLEATRAKTPPEKLSPALALPIEPMPYFLEGHAQAPQTLAWLPPGKPLRAGYAFYQTRLGLTAAFDVEGRAFYLTSENLIVPADHIKAARLFDFHGVELAKPDASGVHLPIGWARYAGIAVYKIDGDKAATLAGQMPLQAYAEIAEKQVSHGGATYFELLHPEAVLGASARAGERYVVKTGELTRIDAALAKDKPEKVAGDERWIEVNIAKQALVVYDGLTPIYATLVSTGAGKGHDTPIGTFHIYAKHLTSRMSAEEKPAAEDGKEPQKAYRFDDVPYVQYMYEGIAFHAAFWHDNFGQPRSHGCINLAAKDALWLFDRTRPLLPEGWHGMNAGRAGIPYGTTVVVTYK